MARTNGATTMANGTSSRGCGSCGGNHRTPSPTAPTYDPCGGGLSATSRGCGCGGRCGGGGGCGRTAMTRRAAPRTYDREQCPTWDISCESKQAMRDCAREALCGLMRCLAETFCPDGRFDIDEIQERGKDGEWVKQLINCVGQTACTFAHCLPDALCGPSCDASPVIDCLPCGYAVEGSR